MAKKKHDGVPTGGAKIKVPDAVNEKLDKFLLDLVSNIPRSKELKLSEPGPRCRELTRAAARDSAIVSGALALPSGPIAVATMLADLFGVWKRQAQLVADVAAACGKTSALNRETMMYCLFKHVSADAMRDLLVRTGHRLAMRQSTVVFVYRALSAVGGAIFQRLLRRALTRWLPFIGAASMAAYAYYDTDKVGRTALEFFRKGSGFSGAKKAS